MELKEKEKECHLWEFSAKGRMTLSLGNEILSLQIKHRVIPTDSGYQSLFMWGDREDFYKMQQYLNRLGSKNFKLIGCKKLKEYDLSQYSKFRVFSEPFERELELIKNRK